MWPIRERKYTAAHIVAKSYPLYLAVRMRRYGSLIKINPSGWDFPSFRDTGFPGYELEIRANFYGLSTVEYPLC